MNSILLLVECHRRGYLSKEASDKVAAIREKLLAKAFRKEAQLFVADLESGIFSKIAALPGSSLFNAVRKSSLSGRMGRVKRQISRVSADDDAWAVAVRRLGTIMGVSAGVGAGAAGVQAVGDKMNRTKMNKRIEKAYPQMFKLESDLNEHDKSTVRRNFQVLATYAPSLASNPVVAATWSLEKAKRGRIEPIEIKSLAETQFAIDRSASREHFMGSPAAKTIMGIATSSMPGQSMEKITP